MLNLQRLATLFLVVGTFATTFTTTFTTAYAATLPRAGLVLQLEAGLGVVKANERITHWYDQSGMGHTMLGTGQPRLMADVLNGQPAIQLADVNSALQIAGITRLPTDNRDRTLAVLLAVDGAQTEFSYGQSGCNSSFGLAASPGSAAATTVGCGNPLHTNSKVTAATWHLYTLILRNGVLFHVVDGQVVDGRSHPMATTDRGLKFSVVPAAGGYARVAAVFGYNWALAGQDLGALQRYVGERYFGNTSRFGNAPALRPDLLPEPQIEFTAQATANGSVRLDWQASFADECGPAHPWTAQSSTSGSQSIPNPVPGTTYMLYCWRSGISAAATASTDHASGTSVRQVGITWQNPPNVGDALNSYRLYWGRNPASYPDVVNVDPYSTSEHTLGLIPGTYFVAMSSVDRWGNEGRKSNALRLEVN